MTVTELKASLPTLDAIRFRLPSGERLPAHFHVTEIGLVTKHFIDCGGVERRETRASLQLLVADDFDHRLAPERFLHILDLSAKVLGEDELEIEVEYQRDTIAKFGLDFDGRDFRLTSTQTACLALDACGLPSLAVLPQAKAGSCTPGGGCC